MSTLQIIFLVSHIIGLYIAGMMICYKLYRKFIYKDDEDILDIEDVRCAAALWIFTAPFLLVVGGITKLCRTMFDIVDGGDNHD